MESGGGSATSTSFSPVEETFADVELAPKKAIEGDFAVRRDSYGSGELGKQRALVQDYNY